MRSLDDPRGIGFLLSLAMLPLAACPSDDSDATASDDSSGSADDDDDDDDDDDSNTMSASMTDPDPDSSSSGPSTVTDPTTDDTGPDPTTESTGPEPTESSTGPSTDDSSSGSSDESTTSAISVSESESETDTESGTTGVELLCPDDIEVPDACTDFADHLIADCYPDYAGYRPVVAHYCGCDVNYYAPMYGDGCSAAYEEYYACLATADCSDLMSEKACPDEIMAAEEACGG